MPKTARSDFFGSNMPEASTWIGSANAWRWFALRLSISFFRLSVEIDSYVIDTGST